MLINETPQSIIGHLQNRGGALDFANNKTLLAERDQEWDASEIPTLLISTELKSNETTHLRGNNFRSEGKNGHGTLLLQKHRRI
jgi:hypothetical protein